MEISEIAKRDDQIFEDYQEMKSFTDVAEKYDLSVERIRQIVRQQGFYETYNSTGRDHHTWIPKEDIIAEAKEITEELERRPTLEDFSFSSSAICKKFGSFYNLLGEVGALDKHSKTRRITNKEIIKQLRQANNKYSDNLTAQKFGNDSEFCSLSLVLIRFDTWNNALKESELDTNTSSHRKRIYSKEEIKEQLKRAADKFDSLTGRKFASCDDFCSLSLVKVRFGSWSNAINEAGIEIR